MKKNNFFWIATAAVLIIVFIALLRLLSAAPDLSGVLLPAGFPTANGLLVIWGFLFLLWGIGTRFVYSAKLSPRRQRNIFLNSLILAGGIFIWNYMIFGAVNFSGALAVAAALLLLGVVVWFMYLVTHRYGGYLFIPMMIWLVYILYLSIAFAVKN